MKIQRALLGVNEVLHYREFWPIIASGWKRLHIEPVVADFGCFTNQHKSEPLNPTHGTIIVVTSNITMPEIVNFHTVHASQCVRLLLGCLFPNDICVLSDFDMLALDAQYFLHAPHIASVPDDCVVIFRPYQYILEGDRNMNPDQIPICYVAAKGSTFRELFPGVETMHDIVNQLVAWQNEDINWCSDQRILYKHICKFHAHHPERVVFLKDIDTKFVRLDRGDPAVKSHDSIHLGSKFSDFHLPSVLNNKEYIVRLLKSIDL